MGYAIGPNFFRREMIFYVFYASANAMIATVSRLNKMLNIIIHNQHLIDSLSSTTCSADSYQEEKKISLAGKQFAYLPIVRRNLSVTALLTKVVAQS